VSLWQLVSLVWPFWPLSVLKLAFFQPFSTFRLLNEVPGPPNFPTRTRGPWQDEKCRPPSRIGHCEAVSTKPLWQIQSFNGRVGFWQKGPRGPKFSKLTLGPYPSDIPKALGSRAKTTLFYPLTLISALQSLWLMYLKSLLSESWLKVAHLLKKGSRFSPFRTIFQIHTFTPCQKKGFCVVRQNRFHIPLEQSWVMMPKWLWGCIFAILWPIVTALWPHHTNFMTVPLIGWKW